MIDLSEKLAFQRELHRYLQELSLLVGRSVHKNELLTLEETKAIRLQANQVIRKPIEKFEIPFEAKQKHRFVKLMELLAEKNPSDVYLWTPASNLCGVMQPVSLKIVNLSFPFNLNPEGIVVFLTSDFFDQILFDYSLGLDEEQILEVELSGSHWGSISY
jgi:hypothetical protein